MKSSIVIVFIFILQSFAITTNDLPYPRSQEINTIIESIAPAESLIIEGKTNKNSEIIKSLLYNAIEKVNDKNHTDFEHVLLRGILWQHLLQSDTETAYPKLEEVSNTLQTQFPNRLESDWLKGITLVNGAEIDSGFKLMEKIRLENDNLPDNFFKDYSQLSNHIFLPNQMQTSNNKLNLGVLPFKTIELSVDERYADNHKWTVISDFENEKSFPIFTFSAEFNLKKSFKIDYASTIKKSREFKIKLPLKNEIQKNLTDSLIYNPDAPPIKMSMKILINKLDSIESLDRYMFDFVYKQYDEIMPLKLNNKNMVAIRCRNNSIIRNLDDEYIVYFAFDKPLILGNKNLFKKNINDSNPQTVRYVVALKTSTDVEDKADILLNELAEKLIQ